MRIRTASIGEVRRCAALVAEALLDDPVGVRAVRARHGRLRRMRALYEAELRLGAFAHGRVDVAEVDGAIVGVAAWVAPMASPDLVAALRQAPRYAFAVGPLHAAGALRAQRIRRAARPDAAHWMLADVAVAEHARGLGIGGALVEHGLALVDGDAYLEATTAASRRLYERHGFVARASIGLAPGGYPVAMWRDARPLPAPALR
ncbi:GNAT family N-acetyltransferase [Agrococcus sp. SGAir0287]|uniref:GNAT family N-acetyltransferase n=1 Tax=Agrococcus sp. SGAir0287 TaxID=2070347 RepID=UPI0010CD5188|nr:GNAT family N-acetyltransferase [Agrococcus sp. SGAir0287]QCR19157.1 GNAT family N-acetyltransferase [Agrococcus sp. SGAir0287]